MICEIEKTFITKLENSGLYGEPVDGLLPQLSRRFPNVTAQQADDAAEQIIRTHGSGSFPKYPACERALKAAIAGAVQPQMAAQSGSGITPQTYFEECRKWLNRFGHGYVVINKTRDAAAWETWVQYFRQIGLHSNADLMSQPREDWTVPTQFPDTFDRQAPLPLSDDDVAKIRRTGRYAVRRELDAAMKAATDHRYDAADRRRAEAEQRRKEEIAAFERWAAEEAGKPLPKASPELAARYQRSAA